MKNPIFAIAIAAIGLVPFGASAQKNIPEAAKTAFHKTYPKVQNPKWETEHENFEGNWKEGGYDHSAMFTPSGEFAGSETDISPIKLPKAAREYLSKNVPEKIREASLNKDAKSITTYEADVKGKAYIFDKAGKFLKTGEGD